jgi:hypothetical protein
MGLPLQYKVAQQETHYLVILLQVWKERKGGYPGPIYVPEMI